MQGLIPLLVGKLKTFTKFLPVDINTYLIVYIPILILGIFWKLDISDDLRKQFSYQIMPRISRSSLWKWKVFSYWRFIFHFSFLFFFFNPFFCNITVWGERQLPTYFLIYFQMNSLRIYTNIHFSIKEKSYNSTARSKMCWVFATLDIFRLKFRWLWRICTQFSSEVETKEFNAMKDLLYFSQ